MHKKVAIIGSVGIPANYGGFETLTEYLTKELHSKFHITVYCSSKLLDKSVRSHNNCTLKYIPLNANGIQSIPYDILSIIHALFFSDILLILGVSGCILLPFVKLFSKKKIIVNIDGLEWKRQKWNNFAKKFLKFSEKTACNYADEIVADNKVIQDHVVKAYNKKANLITYGADHCKKNKLEQSTLQKYPFLKNSYAFKVCRIEPENNIKLILEAFSDQKKLPLVLIGNWSKSEYGTLLKEKFSPTDNIYLLDPIYNQNILNQIRSNAYVYIHGHSAGGTNPSLVEAMYLKLPVLAYGINYNRETTNYNALYFNNKEELIEQINGLNPEVLGENKQAMKNFAYDNYTWKNIAIKYSDLF